MAIKTIGVGSYGVVFSPPIKQNKLSGMLDNITTLEKDQLVGKVFTNTKQSDIQQEWQASAYLKEIDPYHEYFVYPFLQIKLSIEEYNEVAKNPYKNINSTKQLTQFIMVNGGHSMREIGKNHHLTFNVIIECVIQVAKCIKMLQKHHLVHQDIHLGNIVKKNNKFRLIDFGMMLRSNCYYTSANILFGEKYAVNPPEYRLWKTEQKNINSITYEQELLAKYIGIYSEDLNDIFQNKYFTLSYDYLVKSLTNRNPYEYLKEIQSYNKADVYSLGVSLIEMLSYMTDDRVPSNVAPQLSFLIIRMLMPHPENRIDIDLVISKFTAIHHTLNKKCKTSL